MTKRPPKTYDIGCWDLAVSFLADHPQKDTPENRAILASAIQRVIDEKIEFDLEAKTS